MLKIHRNRESYDDGRSSFWVVSGLILELIAEVSTIYTEGLWPIALGITGMVCFVVGLYYFARSKNRSPLWAVLGVLSVLGWFFVAYLEDRQVVEEA